MFIHIFCSLFPRKRPLCLSSSSDEDDLVLMSYGEKRQLVQNISKLPSLYLIKMVYLINFQEPMLKNDSSTVIEVDLEMLKPSTLREVQKYVNNVLRRNERLTCEFISKCFIILRGSLFLITQIC